MEDTTRRRLAAIMFADMVGFTTLMQEDEDEARRQRNRQREVVAVLVAENGGRVLQYYGDGTLSVFSSAVQAVQCAVAVQAELRREPRVLLRIGIHTGDIVDEGGAGVYGDGVNVAARIESCAPPGGVLVSDKVFDEIKNHPDLQTASVGRVNLKNVSRSIELFAVVNDGLVAPVPGDLPGRTSTARRLLAGAVALAAVAGITWASWAWMDARTTTAEDRSVPARSATDRTVPSIAVLPFRNRSSEEEDAAFFADGIHDDILTQLSKIGSIDVIARTSVMQFADTERTIPSIGRELGVATVLDGGVQRAGDRIHLNVQLIDVETDRHLWAESFDRELTVEDVFAIQSEVAEAIARELRAVLTGDERDALSRVPTGSMEAYDLYLTAAAAMRRDFGMADLEIAEGALMEATRIDPGFVQAFARLSYVHTNLYWNAFDRTPERLGQARVALGQAEAIDAGDPEVLVARGYYLYWGFRDYDGAEAAFAQAQAALPGDARLHEALAYVLRRRGEWDEAVRHLRTAASLDPLNPLLVHALGQTLMWMGDFEDSRRALERGLALDSEHPASTFDRAWLDVVAVGDLEGLRSAASSFEGTSVWLFYQWWIAYVDGDDEAAFAATSGWDRPVLEQQASVYPATLLNALVHGSAGREDRARAAADSARALLRGLGDVSPEDPRLHSALGIAHALLGRRDEAVTAGLQAVELMPTDRDAMDGVEYLVELVRIYALLGEADAAATRLAAVLSAPSRYSLAALLGEPALAGLRDHPALERVVGQGQPR